MRIYRLDDEFLKQRRKNWPKAFKTSLVILIVIWLVFFIDAILPISLNSYGIYPRNTEGLIGIFASPFLHSNLAHLMSNSIPLFLAITALFGNYPKLCKRVFILSFIFTGIMVWTMARGANHIGASGILYSLLSFLFFSGFFKRDIQSLGISLGIIFLYGSMIFGMLPKDNDVSWESHLFGFISGLILAIIYKSQDLPVYKVWDFEKEEDE